MLKDMINESQAFVELMTYVGKNVDKGKLSELTFMYEACP